MVLLLSAREIVKMTTRMSKSMTASERRTLERALTFATTAIARLISSSLPFLPICSLSILLLGLFNCGSPFTAEDYGPPSLSGNSGETRGGSAGMGGIRQQEQSLSGSSSTLSAGTSSGGNSAMAGRPAMGSGGAGGALTNPIETAGGLGGSGQPTYPLSCLRNFQTLDCARVCTDSASPGCVAVLSCLEQKAVDHCTDFTSIAISLANSAKRNCCHE
jgi:hypothetical protein